jgi:hypothetical protein
MCKCDVEPGTYSLPNLELPLRIKEKNGRKISVSRQLIKTYLQEKGVKSRRIFFIFLPLNNLIKCYFFSIEIEHSSLSSRLKVI